MAGKRYFALFFLVIALCLCGCDRIMGTDSASSEETEYMIYYTNLEGTKLEERGYAPQSESFDGIMTELLEQFQNPPDTDVSSALPLGVEINGCTMGIDELQVDFNAAYLGISNVQEVLLQAGLVKTLVQLPGVMRVRFTVDGQPLTDDNGYEVPAMDENTFIDTKGEGINSYHYVTLNLYFGSAAGDKIARETRNVYYSSNLIMEQVIVEQIIRGPVNDQLQAVVDPGVGINHVTISGDICVVDLDDTFNQAPEGSSVDPETCLYAFVDAIIDACDVEGVQFEINGETDVRFRNQVNLDQVFERNADIIETGGSGAEPLTEIFLDEDGDETEILSEPIQEQETEIQTEARTTETTAGEGNGGLQSRDRGVGVDPALTGDRS